MDGVRQNPSSAIHREIEAAQVLRAQLGDLVAQDPEFLADTIEGETGLHEAITALAVSIGEDEAALAGLQGYISKLKERAERLNARIKVKRALVASGLSMAEKRSLPTPIGTVSLSPVPPKVEVVQEADIPAEFWKPSAPTLDRKALLAALKDKRSVPGARLSNGGETLRITQ